MLVSFILWWHTGPSSLSQSGGLIRRSSQYTYLYAIGRLWAVVSIRRLQAHRSLRAFVMTVQAGRKPQCCYCCWWGVAASWSLSPENWLQCRRSHNWNAAVSAVLTTDQWVAQACIRHLGAIGSPSSSPSCVSLSQITRRHKDARMYQASANSARQALCLHSNLGRRKTWSAVVIKRKQAGCP